MDPYTHQASGSSGSADAAIHRARLFDLIIDVLQQVIGAYSRERSSHELRRARRPDPAAEETDCVSANLPADVSTNNVAQARGVSYRVLNYTFRDLLGVSPYRYIQAKKLHAA